MGPQSGLLGTWTAENHDRVYLHEVWTTLGRLLMKSSLFKTKVSEEEQNIAKERILIHLLQLQK